LSPAAPPPIGSRNSARNVGERAGAYVDFSSIGTGPGGWPRHRARLTSGDLLLSDANSTTMRVTAGMKLVDFEQQARLRGVVFRNEDGRQIVVGGTTLYFGDGILTEVEQ
jgi:hypothetical protein